MKPKIHYDKLVEIYANDLANGSKVKGPGDEFEINEDQSTKNGGEDGNHVIDESGSHSQANTTPSSSRQSMKRKAPENDPLEAEFIQISKSISSLLEAEKESSLSMNEIKKAFTHEVDVHEKISGNRKELFQILCALPGLTPEQVVNATRLIGQDTAKMDLFFPMPDDYKVIFVRQEIDGSH
ncbi:hypothetical protein SOVF_012650 isoform B [Spinacia oleracea]|nr:hypothetical protein SOVF_012650 isoform B [Spinacia oleracea]